MLQRLPRITYRDTAPSLKELILSSRELPLGDRNLEAEVQLRLVRGFALGFAPSMSGPWLSRVRFITLYYSPG
jgi:hypothetical protein